jgi:hypothetical protein
MINYFFKPRKVKSTILDADAAWIKYCEEHKKKYPSAIIAIDIKSAERFFKLGYNSK